MPDFAAKGNGGYQSELIAIAPSLPVLALAILLQPAVQLTLADQTVALTR
jgi:hypothetical protein